MHCTLAIIIHTLRKCQYTSCDLGLLSSLTIIHRDMVCTSLMRKLRSGGSKQDRGEEMWVQRNRERKERKVL